MGLRYRYVGNVDPNDENRRDGIPGIPARDLTDEDVAALSDEARELVAINATHEAGRIYEAVGVKTSRKGDASEEE